jgi:hypothetical protein
LIDQLYPAVQETLRRRHELLAPAFNLVPQLSPEAFDTFLAERSVPQVGPQWEFYGRGLLLSDIQFWSAE